MDNTAHSFRVKMPLHQLSDAEVAVVEQEGIEELVSVDHKPRDPYYADAFISKDGRQIYVGVQGEKAYALNISDVVETVIQLHKMEREAAGIEPPKRPHYVNKFGYLLKKRMEERRQAAEEAAKS